MVSLEDIRPRYPDAVTFKFGDSEAMSAALLALVKAGRKTATCGAAAFYDTAPGALPMVGRRDIALNWDGTPAVAIETMRVYRCRFRDVGEDFALAEGENDDLAGWRRDHQAYFERNEGFSPDMMLVCEMFRVVEIFNDPA